MSELDSFRIDSKLVKIDNNCRLGTGSFGTVHGGIYNNRKVAIKKIHSSPHLTINHVYREIRILAGCVHDAIIHFVGFYEKPQKPNIVYLVTEMADDSLAEVLIPTAYHDIKIVDNGKLELFWIDHYNFAHALHWMLMAAEGIAYLHSREIIHRDVKPSNMLLFDQHRILKLCDFGTVTRFDTMTYNQQGTARYCAPEVYRTQCSYSIDIYSWGITFWEVIARRYPFEYLHHCLQIVFSTNEREKPSKILGVPDVVEDLYVQCYHHDASQRPSAEDLVKILTEWLSHFQDLRCEEIDRVGPYYFDENECPVIFSLSSSESELEDTNPPNAVTSDGNIRDFEVVSKDDCHNYLEAEVNRPRRLSDSSCPLPNGKPELPRAFSHSSITSHVKSIFGSFVDVLAHPALKRHSTVEQCNSRDLDPIPYHNLTPSKPVKGDKVSESIYANHQNAYEEWVDLQRNILQIKENCKFVNVDIENISKIQNAEELVNHLISLNNSLEQEITTLKQTSNSDERFINVEMLNSDQRRYILAIITALLCERINIVWFPLLIPLETERRKIDIIHVAGLTSTQYAAAWVSSSFLAVCFLKFGARRSAYNLVIGSCSLLCFTGLATAAAAQIGADITFLFALYVLAIGKGVFSGAVFSAINTVAITEFKDFVQQVKAIASIAYIVGCIISIVLASAALDIAGIWASCIATAVFGLIFLAVTIFIMPSLITVAQSTPKTVAEIGGSRVRKLLSLPELIATLTTHSACFALMSASGTGLAPFLRNTFDLSSLGTGVVSSLSFLGMALGAVVWAHVGQKFSSRRVSTLWTALALGALSCFVGPDPWMCSLSPSIIITTIGLCMGGFLLACQHVSNAEELRIMALARGFSSGMETGSALGSLLAASEDVSGLVGPVVGALLNREWGFPRMMTLTGFAVFIFGFARMVILIFQDCRLMRLSKLSAVTI